MSDQGTTARPEAAPWGEAALEQQLANARAGSKGDLAGVLEVARRYLLAVANRHVADDLQAKAGASDLVQESLLEAHRHFARFEGHTGGEFLGWMRAILLNKLDDFNRSFRGTTKRDVRREVALAVSAHQSSSSAGPEVVASTTPSPSELATKEESRQAVAAAIERLPPHYRQVVTWRQWDDLSFEEIGQRLKEPRCSTNVMVAGT